MVVSLLLLTNHGGQTIWNGTLFGVAVIAMGLTITSHFEDGFLVGVANRFSERL